MAEATEPVLDTSRILFLDARNRKFVEKTSPVTARYNDARDTLWKILLILAIFGAVLFAAVRTHKIDSKLVQSGKVTTGAITGKYESVPPPAPGVHFTFGSTHRGHICRVTYTFSVPPTYERQTDIAYELCPTLAEGQAVEVLYDPQQPLHSNLKVSVEKPLYRVWPAVIGFLIVLATIPAQMSKIRNQRRLFTDGQVICASIVSRDIEDGLLKIRHQFRAPDGITITAQSKALLRRSSWSYDSQFFPDKPDSAAVLFLSDGEFYLL